MLIIGITGGFGSGKTTATSYFAASGFKSITLSQFLEEEARRRGISKITRKILQDIGNEWRRKYGAGILAKKALELAKKSSWEKIVIDGIRNLAEVVELRREKGFILLGIITSREERFERERNRKRREDLSWELFNKLDRRDMGLGQKKYGLQIKSCLEVADVKVTNNGSRAEFEIKLKGMMND